MPQRRAPLANVEIPATSRPRAHTRSLLAVAGMALLLAGGCQRGPEAGAEPKAADAKDAAEKGAGGEEGVTLKPEEVAKAGVETVPAAAAKHAPEAIGYGVVVAQDAIAQALADLAAASAAERQSSAAVARARGLAGTPGAGSIEALESAERQAALDRTAHALAARKLAALYGSAAPWKTDGSSAELNHLAEGSAKLVRVTFPLGALGTATPRVLRLTSLDAPPDAKAYAARLVWAAPADATVPGRSFFALVGDAHPADGERLLVRTEVGAMRDGVIVPFGSVLINAGRYWCYLEEKPGHYVRTEVPTGQPTDDGYFVAEGIEPGARIVSAAAGTLLAKEFGAAAAD